MHPETYPLHMKTKNTVLMRFQNARKMRILLLGIEKKWSKLWVESDDLDNFYHALEDADYETAFQLSKQLETLWLNKRYKL